jgi:uncharacterized protein YbbK (DUF523 family)
VKVLVSACLLGENCKYNGGNNHCPAVIRFLKDHTVIPVCPEAAAGLGIPRTPVEIVDGVVKTKDGVCVDGPLRNTVSQLVQQLKDQHIDCAVLKSRSPTCGVNQVYDGSFTGKLIPGSGVFAQALQQAGFRVVDAEDIRRK